MRVVLMLAVCLSMFVRETAADVKNRELIPVLEGILAKYERCIIEKYETTTTAGLEHRDKSTCSDGSQCDRASRRAAWNKLQALARDGDPTNFEKLLKSAVLKDCINCAKHHKWHTKHTHCTMDCGGNNDFKPNWKPGRGMCFEGCKAGVDIDAFFEDVGKELEKMHALSRGNFDGEGATHFAELEANQSGGLTVATNRNLTTPTEGERCDGGIRGYFVAPEGLLDWTSTEAPSWNAVLTGYDPGKSPARNAYDQANLKNIGANEGRLRADLRAIAKRADPRNALCKAVVAFGQGKDSDATAFADLSVTGRRTFAAFKARPPTADEIATCAKRSLRGKSDADIRQWTDKALARAYRVAQVTRAGGWPKQCSERTALGYIAVSGEDDQPHRPVNAPSAEFQQHDLAVKVGRVTVNTRYMIAQTNGGGGAPSCADQGLTLPREPAPVLDPKAEVILFIHGMDSRLEEALDLTHALHKLGLDRNKNYTVIAVDLPTSGYADNIDYNRISPITALGRPYLPLGFKPTKYAAPTLDFIENFVVAFMNKLDDQLPGATKQLKAVVGGSLGGNLSMRLGRPRPDAPWITAVVPWSPAGMWESKADKDIEHVALRLPWTFAGGDATYRSEKPWSRAGFFFGGFDFQSKVFGIFNVTKPQAEEWYAASWPCKATHLRMARVDRYETYNEKFRRWHWRLAAEQMMFSHTIKKNGAPLYAGNTKRTLLICGVDDTGGGLCEATRKVAADMKYTPGHALFLTKTGHSIQNERPNFLARHLADFIVPSVNGISFDQDYVRTPARGARPRRINAVSPEACRDACRADRQCKAYSYVRPGAAGAGCSLHDQPSTKVFAVDGVSGAKR